MKKIYSILILLLAFASAEVQGQACCPEFKMAYKRDFDCTREGPCNVSANGVSVYTGSNCKYSTNTFLVVPNLPGYTYSWVVTGGTPTTATGNPVTITWGGGGSGTIVVTITSADGSCVRTIKETICLRDAPVASFIFNPNNACAGTVINFSNTSTGGAGVSWDFGDGSFAGNTPNPTHAYAAAGVYTVTIYVTNDTTPCIPHNPAGGGIDKPCCGCISTYTQQVNVVAGSPLSIIPKNCVNQCLCAGDTMEYCISQPCGSYNWTITGGVFIPPSGNNTQCVKVKWTGPYPTTISFSGSCGNPCGNTATLSVPVLVNNIPILPGTSPVCQGSTQTYYLPAMPGVLYNWTVTGGVIAGPNTNTSTITVVWGMGTSGTITCSYSNPLKQGCSGTSTRTINLLPVLKITGPTQGCVGCPANFISLSGPVTWSSPTGAIVFSPVVGPNTTVTFPVSATTNTYTITATGPYCNSPVSVVITVAPKPVLTILPNAATACPGTQIKFVATSTVTTSPINWFPLPAGATMIANTGPQLDTAVIQFGTIPGAGVTVTATQNCAFNLACSQGTASVLVKKPPVPILSTPVTNPCIDQTQSYSITNYDPAITYTWTITNNLGTITTGQGTGSINVLWHGNNIAGNTGVLTVTNCSGSASATINVTLPPAITITPGGTCIKNGMTLTSSTLPAYSWTGPGIVGASNTQTININQPGTYCVTDPNAAGSCGVQKCITIPPNPYWVKIIPPCSVSSCNPATLSVPLTVATNIIGATNCKWIHVPLVGLPYVISTSCATFTATLLGSYYLVIVDANGCKDTSNVIRIPEDINICCTTPACSALSGTHFLFTHTGCQPTSFTGTALTLPPGWTTGTLHPTICYGDGTSDDFISLNTTHQYPAAGDYTACVVQKVVNTNTNDTCCVMDCQHVIIPVVARFTASYDCNTGFLTMTDISSYFPNNSGASWTWTYSGAYTGTLTNGPNQSITPTASGNYTITLSVTLNGCTSTYSLPILIIIPAAPITINPNPNL
jgi:PKD repeat protein